MGKASGTNVIHTSSFHPSWGARLAQGTSSAATHTVATPFAATSQAATPPANTRAEAPAGTQEQQPAQTTQAEPERTRSDGDCDAKPEQKPEPAAAPAKPRADSSNPPASTQVRWLLSGRSLAFCSCPCRILRAAMCSTCFVSVCRHRNSAGGRAPLAIPATVCRTFCWLFFFQASAAAAVLCAYMSFWSRPSCSSAVCSAVCAFGCTFSQYDCIPRRARLENESSFCPCPFVVQHASEQLWRPLPTGSTQGQPVAGGCGRQAGRRSRGGGCAGEACRQTTDTAIREAAGQEAEAS